MEVTVTGDRYIDKLVKFVDHQAGLLIEGIKVLKLNPAGLHYVQCRLEVLHELESLLSDAPVDYLRAYVSDLGDFRALEQLRRILRLLPSLKVVSALPPPLRDPTPLSLLPFGRLKVLELRGCDLSTSAAKGLLELRHTLEKIICHNSTDALRHVFASRIVEIKDSPQWNRLSFVSCACNRLVLMDESLQLLPAVEALDLSRNKFAKIDNLRKCTKLKHLDLGFNHLRSVSFFSEVSCHIVKLVLRNNALTKLHGIGNLKSLEALDVSYNTIANFSELECLSGLPSLKSLWLEGNPLCCARWYRAQVYSYFAHPENLKVDDEEISNKEYWKMRIIVARRQKQPASFGFYSPAKGDAEGDGSVRRKKIKVSRLASIESEEESTYVGSDRETASCDDESPRVEEKPMPDDETEIVDLIKRVEQMKKERSIHWLREFKEWMDHSSENDVNGCDHHDFTSLVDRENYRKIKRSKRNIGECSRYVSDSILASGDESSTNILESDNSFAEAVPSLQENWQYEQTGSEANIGGIALPNLKMLDLKQEYQNFYSSGRKIGLHIKTKNNRPGPLQVQRENLVVGSQLTAVDMECLSLLPDPGSPPHYQKDLMHRRHNLVEEILQLSADSYSVASSDTDTSGSEDDSSESDIVQEIMDRKLEENMSDANLGSYQSHNEADRLVSEKNSSISSLLNPDKTSTIFGNGAGVCSHDPEVAQFGNQDADWMEKRNFRRKPKKRVVPLLENGKLDSTSADDDNQQEKLDANVNNCQKLCVAGESCGPAHSEDRDDFILDYYNKNIANTKFLESCMECVCCICILDESTHEEREVALLRGSNDKLYLLLVGLSADGTGTILSLLSHYSVDDIQEIVVGLGLQVVRVAMKGSTDILFMTRSMDRSTKLLHTLKVLDSRCSAGNCSLWSLEHVQVEIIEKQIFGGLKAGIYQYSMVLFQRSGEEEYSWNSRSVLVIDGHVLLCIEDLFQFSCSLKDGNCSAYFSLDLCCRISDVCEIVIEATESRCLTLSLRCTTSQFGPYSGSHESESQCPMLALRCAASLFCPYSGSHENDAAEEKERSRAASQMWRLKWFSEESLTQFVALLKAIHLGTTSTPLLVRRVP